MNGLLIIDKPVGLTSHDVVYRVRKRARIQKVGHTGTLDPFATGVLPLCLGRATRLANLLLLEDKGYDATLRLGVTTDTLDLEGKVLEERPVDPEIDAARLEAVLARFRGVIRQTPPMYSAIKVGGKSLHEYARAGIEVERAEREVTILGLELTGVRLPEVSIRVHCSKGTYIRVLAQDIGEALGCGAHLVALRRTFTGPFDLSRAITLETFDEKLADGSLEGAVIPMVEMLPGVPRIELSGRTAERVTHGNPVLRRELAGLGPLPEGGAVQLVREGELLAVGDVVGGLSGPGGGVVIQPRIVI